MPFPPFCNLTLQDKRCEVCRQVNSYLQRERQVNNNGSTALIEAASTGELEVARLLLERGADVHAKNNNGSTSLIEAASTGELEVARLLLERGADVHTKNNNGSTALTTAKHAGHSRLLSMLARSTSNPKRRFEIFVKVWTGETATLSVEPSDQTQDVKIMITNMVGSPLEFQRIIYAGRQLEDGRTLEEQKIRPECTLHLRCRLVGDWIALDVVSTVPAAGSFAVAPMAAAIVTVVVGERMKAHRLFVDKYKACMRVVRVADEQQIAGTVTYNADTRSLIFTGSNSWQANAVYRVEIDPAGVFWSESENLTMRICTFAFVTSPSPPVRLQVRCPGGTFIPLECTLDPNVCGALYSLKLAALKALGAADQLLRHITVKTNCQNKEIYTTLNGVCFEEVPEIPTFHVEFPLGTSQKDLVKMILQKWPSVLPEGICNTITSELWYYYSQVIGGPQKLGTSAFGKQVIGAGTVVELTVAYLKILKGSRWQWVEEPHLVGVKVIYPELPDIRLVLDDESAHAQQLGTRQVQRLTAGAKITCYSEMVVAPLGEVRESYRIDNELLYGYCFLSIVGTQNCE